jgi:predicted TIM-barrel fold metal-dependent hydrolase
LVLAGLAAGGPLPIIDAHGHLNGDMTAERLVELMDQAGVRGMVLMARTYGGKRAGGNGSDQQALDYARRFPGRFIPFVAGQRGDLLPASTWTAQNRTADTFLRRAEAKLEAGGFHGLGEFILRHYDYSNFGTQGGGEVFVQVDTPLMYRIAGLAEAHRVPVLFHAEAETVVVAQMTRLLSDVSRTVFIWAHNCGRNSAEEIGALLARYPNLMCDLGGMAAPGSAGYGTYWPRRTDRMHVIEDGQGHLLPDMARLFETFPDRFVIGTDAAHTPALTGYVARIARFRELLAQLRPDTAEKLAYKNAERLFRLPR